MHSYELEMLIREYAEPASKEDAVIGLELQDIAALYAKCKDDEVYSEAITRKFCHLIRMLKRQHEKALATARESGRQEEVRLNFAGYRESCVQFQSAEHLLCAFYNHFKKPTEVDYREIRDVPEAEKKEAINMTLRDYVARIYTFAGEKYLQKMFRPEEIGRMDPVLFTYENIELILATFHTKDKDGMPVKQKVNIRSALRKLNQFKREQERNQ